MKLDRQLIATIKPDSCKVYLVSGDYVRTNLNIEFNLGGHHWRFPFIPREEIWLEDTGSSNDIGKNMAHEVLERFYMKELKLEYESAHKIASNFENALRTVSSLKEQI